jgi:hypothetical protein
MSFNLPLKKKAQFPRRRTLCISKATDNLLTELERLKSVDVPELMRIALEEYIEKNKLEEITKEG